MARFAALPPLVFALLILAGDAAAANLQTDAAALLEWVATWTQLPFTSGPDSSDEWDLSKPICSTWYGVSCNEDGTRVTGISIYGGAFKLSPVLAKLGRLEELFCETPGLTGTLPPELGRLKRLKTLYLNNVNVTGTFPSGWQGMVRLERLVISGTKLGGRLPRFAHMPPNVANMELDRNFFSGDLRRDWWQLENLVSLKLSTNPLTGNIPRTYSKFKALEWLELTDTLLGRGGPLPHAKALPKTLKALSLSANRFVGPWPASWRRELLPPSLDTLGIAYNMLTGALPLAEHLPENLKFFDASHNYFRSWPGTYGELKKLSQLYINNNRVESLPEGYLGPSIFFIQAQANRITGELPATWAQPGPEGASSSSSILLYDNPRLGGRVPDAWAAEGSIFAKSETGIYWRTLVVKPDTALCGKVPDGVGAFYGGGAGTRKPLTKTLGKCNSQ